MKAREIIQELIKDPEADICVGTENGTSPVKGAFLIPKIKHKSGKFVIVAENTLKNGSQKLIDDEKIRAREKKDDNGNG